MCLRVILGVFVMLSLLLANECAPESTPIASSDGIVDNDVCLSWIKDNLFVNKQNNSAYWDASGHLTLSRYIQRHIWLGFFDGCLGLPQANYCMAELTLNSSVLSDVLLGQTLEQGVEPVAWGLCVSYACNATILNNNMPYILQGVLSFPNDSLIASDVHCAAPDVISKGFIGALILLFLFLFICIMGTAFDLYHQYKVNNYPHLVHCIDDQGPHLIHPTASTSTSIANPGGDEIEEDLIVDQQHLQQLVQKQDLRGCTLFCHNFSLAHHMKVLFATNKPSSLACLDGIRVLSMLWIMLGHTQLGMFSTPLLENPGDMSEWTKTVWWQPLGNAFFAVDTFFFLSGLLAVYCGLQKIDAADGQVPVLKIYLLRYVRLMPCVGVTMLVYIFVIPELGSGPFWYPMREDPLCAKYWWANLIFLQNFYPVHMEQQCMGWLWYVTLDFQFFLLMPMILYGFLRTPKKTIIILISMCVLSWLITGLIIGLFNVDVNFAASVLEGNTSAAEKYEDYVYGKPYCRIVPYIVGVLMGYVFYTEKTVQKTMSKGTNKPTNLAVDSKQSVKILPQFMMTRISFSWVGLLVVIVGVLWAVYPRFLSFHGNLGYHILYGTFSSSLWAMALALLVYVCQHGYGSIVGSFLSWSGWQPLARLTFTAYLCHPLVMIPYTNSSKAVVHASVPLLINRYYGYVVMSYAVALVLSLLVEMPIASLQKYMKNVSG